MCQELFNFISEGVLLHCSKNIREKPNKLHERLREFLFKTLRIKVKIRFV